MTIGELARRTGVAASAIRYYESEGLLPEPARRSGRRVYDEGALVRLDRIAMAQQAGLSLDEIRQLTEGLYGERSAAWGEHARQVLARVRATRQQLQRLETALEQALVGERDDGSWRQW